VLPRFGEATFFATIEDAVKPYLSSHPVEWADLEDRLRD